MHIGEDGVVTVYTGKWKWAEHPDIVTQAVAESCG